MVKVTPTPANQKRKPRLLWANPFCLLDTSSGASMTVRQMLLQLVARGYDVQVLGATVFDNPKGMGELQEQFPDLNTHLHQLIEAEDGPLTHQLVVSYSHNRNHLTAHEEGLWYSQYLYLLDTFKPDVVWYYGGQTLDMLIAAEARDRGIPVAFYLANGNYKAPNWCRDVDVILTDSQATADMYRKEVGYTAKPIGKFIAPERFVAEHHERKRLLFVNPSWQKGASVFVQLAEKLARERPDIALEVVEARADWSAVLRDTTKRMGKQHSTLSNVTVTANTSDMRGPYSRARVLVAPSLWWESSGRVLAEAMLNGIPALITNRGGMPEMIGDAGITFDFPEACYKEPYQHLLSEEELQPLVDAVVNFFDNEALYQEYVTRAWQVGKDKHHLDRATDRLINALTPLVGLRAGNKDFAITQKKRHRQRLASRAAKPEFKVDHSFKQLMSPKAEVMQGRDAQIGHLWLAEGFSWQFKSKIIVLDNRASLIKNGLAEQMAETNAFGIVAFDPASEVKDVKRFEGSEHIQVFQHALLGDGKAATLHACVAPEMTSTLAPLPAESLPKRYQLNAKPLAELPINSVALDSINGLDSLDWLILDELSDAMAILEHGKNYLTSTLLVQARVPFQLTHEKQPSLAELQHWATRNGFRFYRFHNISHHSHLPKELNERTHCATEQESADVLFLPSHERMATLNDENKTKLAFILSAVFAAHDIAFDLLADVGKEKAMEFLEAHGYLQAKASYAQKNALSNRLVNYSINEKMLDKLAKRAGVVFDDIKSISYKSGSPLTLGVFESWVGDKKFVIKGVKDSSEREPLEVLVMGSKRLAKKLKCLQPPKLYGFLKEEKESWFVMEGFDHVDESRSDYEVGKELGALNSSLDRKDFLRFSFLNQLNYTESLFYGASKDGGELIKSFDTYDFEYKNIVTLLRDFLAVLCEWHDWLLKQKPCVCHNDPTQDNIVYCRKSGQYKLIDWDKAGVGFFGFDPSVNVGTRIMRGQSYASVSDVLNGYRKGIKKQPIDVVNNIETVFYLHSILRILWNPAFYAQVDNYVKMGCVNEASFFGSVDSLLKGVEFLHDSLSYLYSRKSLCLSF